MDCQTCVTRRQAPVTNRSDLEKASMKKLFLLMALIVTLAQFNAIAHGAQNAQPASAMPAQNAGCMPHG